MIATKTFQYSTIDYKQYLIYNKINKVDFDAIKTKIIHV